MTMLATLNAFIYVFIDVQWFDDCNQEHEMILPETEDRSKMKKVPQLQTAPNHKIVIKSNSLRSYQNPDIIENGCSLTILFVDPRVNKAKPKSEIWYALESMATNVVPRNRTCVVFHTSSACGGSPGDTYRNIKRYAQPLFRSMIDMGNVRVDFIQHGTYPVGTCNWNVNRLFMHPDYWTREFSPQDSDLVIVLQPDSVFCHTFDVSLWTDFAYVGGVWPPKPNTHNNPAPPGGVCVQIPKLWKEWGNTEPFPDVCTEGRAPLGNGGFSLRSRRYMTLATNTCRSHHFGAASTKCFIKGDVAEDLYFATVLSGISAPMPNPIEAALFGVEMLFLEKSIEYYQSNITESQLENTIRKRWGDNGLIKYNRMKSGGGTTVPIGLHKPYWYHTKEFLNSPFMKQECPFLEHILPKNYKI